MSDPSTKPQIAIVCDTVPYPARSGDNQRTAELIRVLRESGWFVHLILAALLDRKTRELCRRHTDALYTYSGHGLRTRVRNGLRRSVRLFDGLAKHVGLPPAEEIAGRILGAPITPLVLDYWQRYPSGLDNFVAHLAKNYPLKAIIVEYIWLHPAVRKLTNGTARLLDTHDIQHKRVEEFASRGIAFPLTITRDEEARIFNQFDAVIAIQAEEASLVRALCPELRVLTVGSTGSSPPVNDTRPINGRILYVGGYNGANIDGLRRFLRSIWPLIRKQNDQCHLHVCGYIYRAFLGEHFDNVELIGHLVDVEPEYREALVVINPSWIGTGLKIKSVEALSRNKPLVTTTKGVEGLHRDVHQACLITDDNMEFAARVVDLLTNSHLRDRYSDSAREFATTHLSSRTVYNELFEFLQVRQ